MIVHSEIRRANIGTPRARTALVSATTGEAPKQLSARRWGVNLGALLVDTGFALWRLRHRGGSFGEFQASVIEPRRRHGNTHENPGMRRSWTELLGTPSVDTAEFRRRGRRYFDWFRDRNLSRDMTCIDYGCGGLRVGQHFIDYLDAGHYLGLDIVDCFYRNGLTMISGKVIARHQPRFQIISEEALERARETRPDLVFSTAVVQHVPPQELAHYFGNIIAMMHERSTAVVHFKAAPMTTRIATSAWAHSPVSLIAALAANDPDMHARIEVAGPASSCFRRDALIFSRDARELSKWLRQVPDQAPGFPMKGGREETYHVI